MVTLSLGWGAVHHTVHQCSHSQLHSKPQLTAILFVLENNQGLVWMVGLSSQPKADPSVFHVAGRILTTLLGLFLSLIALASKAVYGGEEFINAVHVLL